MEPYDETDMSAEEFDRLVAAGEPIETVSTRREYEASAFSSWWSVLVTSSWANFDASTGAQNSAVTVATSSPAPAMLHAALQVA